MSVNPDFSAPPPLPSSNTTATQATQTQKNDQPPNAQLCILAAVFMALANSVNVGSSAAIARSQGLSNINEQMTQQETAVGKLSLVDPTGSNVEVMSANIQNQNTMQLQSVADAQMGTLQQDSSVGQSTLSAITQNINGTLSELTAAASIMTSVATSATLSKPVS